MENSEKITNFNEKSPDPAWWIWIALLQQDDTRKFVYGCAALTFRSVRWKKNRLIEIADAGELKIYERLITVERFNSFLNDLNSGFINIDSVVDEQIPSPKVMARREVIQECLGHGAARATLYYTMPDINALIGPDDIPFEHMVTILQNELNLPFKELYAARLGNFEIFNIQDWLELPKPFLCKVKKYNISNNNGPQKFEITRTSAFACAQHMAHFVGRADNDKVIDRFVILPVNQKCVSLTVPEALDSYEFRLFDETGETILHFEKSSFFRQMNVVMNLIGRQTKLEDDLTKRAKSKGGNLQEKTAVIASITPVQSQIGAPAAGSWRKFADDMKNVLAARLPKPSEDKWFSRGIEGEIGAIAHINGMLSDGNTQSAVLIDPWFGVDALSRFGLRVTSQSVQLTIVTSWTDKDPDTDMLFPSKVDATQKLASALSRVRPFLNPKIQFLNVVDGKDKAFHDRYLMINPHQGLPKVFQLSNSINSMSRNWPFSISLFAPDVARQLQRYIEGLCECRDITRSRPLTLTFRWPDRGR